MVVLLEQHRATPRPDLGRNDACWCGSGHEYKKCHPGREQLPLSERADWLYTKAAQHTVLTGWRDLLAEVGHERTRYITDDDDADDSIVHAASQAAASTDHRHVCEISSASATSIVENDAAAS